MDFMNIEGNKFYADKKDFDNKLGLIIKGISNMYLLNDKIDTLRPESLSFAINKDTKRLLSDPIYCLLWNILKRNSLNYIQLEYKKDDSLLTYRNAVNKLIFQYHDVGRICSILTHYTREIKEKITKIKEFCWILEEETTLEYDEIKSTLDTILNNIKTLQNKNKTDLIKKMNEQCSNIQNYIDLLNKENSYKIVQHINSDISTSSKLKIEYPDNTFTKPIPNILFEKTIETIVTTEFPMKKDSSNKDKLNIEFYNKIIPKNKFNKLYFYSKTLTGASKINNIDKETMGENKFFYDQESLDYIQLNMDDPNNNNINISNTNTNNLNDLYPIFHSIRNDYLNYQKHIYLQKLYTKLDIKTATPPPDKTLWENINKEFEPMKDVLLAPGLYLKTVDNLLKENFKQVAYNTAINLVNATTSTYDSKRLIVYPQPKEIRLSKLLEDTTEYAIDIAAPVSGNLAFNKDLIEDSSYINKTFDAMKDKIQRLYEINKLNDTNKICIYNGNAIVESLLNKSKGKHNIADNNGNTPLMYAINGLLVNVINEPPYSTSLTISDILHTVNKQGIRPIHQAAINMDNYFTIFYKDTFTNIMDGITGKYTTKYQSELKAIPEFGNNLLKSSKNSLNKFTVLLMYYLNDRIKQNLDINYDAEFGLDNNALYDFAALAVTYTNENQFYLDKEARLKADKKKIDEHIEILTKKIKKLEEIYNLGAVTGKKTPSYTVEIKYKKYVKAIKDLTTKSTEINTILTSGKFKDLSIAKSTKTTITTKINDVATNKIPFPKAIINIINVDNAAYSASFNEALLSLDISKNEGLLLLKLLQKNYTEIVQKLKVAFENVNKTKELKKADFENIKKDIEKYINIYKEIENIMRKYERNPSLSKIRSVEKNETLRDITLLYHSVLLSDITYNFKDSILSAISQYLGETRLVDIETEAVSGVKPTSVPTMPIDYKTIDEKLTKKMITNKFSASVESDNPPKEPEQTFTGILLLNNLNLKYSSNDKNPFVYKDIGVLLDDINNVLTTYITSVGNADPKLTSILEKTIFAFYKKNYTLLIDGLQHVYNDIMAYYINCGRHLTIMKTLLEKLGI
jgi:hypothetical protein